ncbi:hypothetical protein [Sanguibacter sp. Leaf3]|uniref:hypothetical protein n=1 Tax=Sanguibacter sp. Leaf3 TaxID=1736209 RepID=UPI0006F5C52D|nr:hypothetical protein [Sanguibacter sp. Leaf3]KQT96484.1 hypothetical protein ASG53_15395 [Sanguibacter sp. Leaf3]
MIPAESDRTLTEELLSYAALDWVDPGMLMTIVRDVSGVRDPDTLRDLSVGLVARLMVEGMITVGDVLEDGFHAWTLSPGEVLIRLVREWTAEQDPFAPPGSVAWFNATPAGQVIGEANWDAKQEDT